MPDLSPVVASVAAALLAVFLLWFALGTQRNIRIGNDVLRWLQDGLPLLGRRTTVRWLGSAAVELRITEATDPFRDVTVHVVMEPRDIALLWAWARLHGRRDFVIIRANLQVAPTGGTEAWARDAWTGQPAAEAGWEPIAWDAPGVQARTLASSDTGPVRTAWAAIARTSPAIWRLTVQPVVPHLEVQLRLPDRSFPARRLVEPLRELGKAVGGRQRTTRARSESGPAS